LNQIPQSEREADGGDRMPVIDITCNGRLLDPTKPLIPMRSDPIRRL
jgi:hypothetical protein